MKRLLACLFSLLPMLTWAASPSFDSFRQTNSGFIVNQPYIYVANTNTGGMIVYTNTTINYFNTTNNYDGANITITNSTVTITNSTVTINGTNVATINPTVGRIPFKFSDFQFGDSALYYIDTNTVGTTELDTDVLKLGFANVPTLLVAGANNIDVTDHSVLVLASTDPSAQLRLNSGNGNVTMLLVYHAGTTAFSLLNGDSLWDGSGGKLYLSGGDWVPTADGEAMLMFKTPIGWSEDHRFNANTNVIVTPITMNPTDGYVPIRLNSTTFGDSAMQQPSTNTIYFHNEGGGTSFFRFNGPGTANFSFSDAAGMQFNASTGQVATLNHDAFLSSVPVKVYGFGYGSGTDYSDVKLSMAGTNGFGDVLTEAAGSAGDPRPLRFLIGTDQVGIPYNGDTANTSYGFHALNAAIAGSVNNEAYGYNALLNLTTGTENSAFGLGALLTLATANYNAAFGNASLKVNTGDFNTAIGNSAGSTNSSGAGNVYVGYNANPNAGSDTDTIVIGKNAVGKGSNTALIGDANVTVLWLAGTVGWFQGSGTPEGSVTAPVGSFYSNTSGGAGTSFYVKETGSGNTGWAPK